MKSRARKIALSVCGLVLWLLLVLVFWAGWRFVQAGQRFGHLYDVNQRLWQASWQGQTALVEYCLADGADANYSDAGMTVLQEAVESGNPKTVAALLRHGADANEFVNDYSPLRMAREEHKEAIVALLKQAGAKK